MLKCQLCGLEFKEATTYCPQCGSLVQLQKTTLTGSNIADWFIGLVAGFSLFVLLTVLVVMSIYITNLPGIGIVVSIVALAAYLTVAWMLRLYSRSFAWGIVSNLIGMLLLFLGILVLCGAH